MWECFFFSFLSCLWKTSAVHNYIHFYTCCAYYRHIYFCVLDVLHWSRYCVSCLRGALMPLIYTLLQERCSFHCDATVSVSVWPKSDSCPPPSSFMAGNSHSIIQYIKVIWDYTGNLPWKSSLDVHIYNICFLKCLFFALLVPLVPDICACVHALLIILNKRLLFFFHFLL